MLPIVREINTKVEQAWMSPPKDMARMNARRGAKGSNLTIAVYAQGDTNSAAYYLYMVYTMATEKRGNLETLKDLASAFCSFLGIRFQEYYHMEDAELLSMRTALAIKDVGTHEELAEVLQAIQHYYGQLAYWIDLAIPWSELSVEHARIMKRRERGT